MSPSSIIHVLQNFHDSTGHICFPMSMEVSPAKLIRWRNHPIKLAYKVVGVCIGFTNFLEVRCCRSVMSQKIHGFELRLPERIVHNVVLLFR